MFDNPKPVKLLKILIDSICDENDLILDFFSGSATTAHAVMELNAEDGGNRQFILVQLPEPTDEKSEAYKAGYKNICEIGKERIRRAGEKIKEDYKDKELIDNLDIGFKVFKLDSTNFKEWDASPDNLEKSLLDYEEFIKEDRSEEDLLYEVLLKYGIDLTAPIEEKEINGKKVYIVGFGKLIIYFDEIDIEIAKEIVNLVKEKKSDFSILVLKDDSFASSRDKVNIAQFFKQMNLFEKIITL
jgi:adenine-specific DNA-methyltransferase